MTAPLIAPLILPRALAGRPGAQQAATARLPPQCSRQLESLARRPDMTTWMALESVKKL
jgi:hypothetical protein